MKTYRAGIIGIGDIGFKHPYVTHPEVYKMASNCELVAVCDIEKDRLDRFCKVWEVEKTYTDYREMLEDADLDIVSICTPHNLHCEMTLKAAEEGVHILCEKPIAISLEEADAMIEACDRAGVKLAVISPRRFLKVFRELKSIVAQKEPLGELKFISIVFFGMDMRALGGWLSDFHGVGGGNLMYNSPHLFELVRYLAGDVSWVSGHVEHNFPDSNQEDRASTYLHFSNGVNSAIEGSYIGGFMSLEMDFYFSNGRVNVNQSFSKKKNLVKCWRDEGKPLVDGVYIAGDPIEIDLITDDRPHKEVWSEAWVRQAEDLISAIDEDREPEVSGREGRAALELIMATFESERRGGERIELPLKEKKNPWGEMLEGR